MSYIETREEAARELRFIAARLCGALEEESLLHGVDPREVRHKSPEQELTEALVFGVELFETIEVDLLEGGGIQFKCCNTPEPGAVVPRTSRAE